MPDKMNNVKLKPIEGSLTSYRYYSGLPQNQKSQPTRRLQIQNISGQWDILVSGLSLICRVTGIRSTLFKTINIIKLGNPVSLATKPLLVARRSVIAAPRPAISPTERLDRGNSIPSSRRGQDGHQANSTWSPIMQNWPAYIIGYSTRWLKLSFSSQDERQESRRIRNYSTSAKDQGRPLTQPSIDRHLTRRVLDRLKSGEWLSPELKQDLNIFIEKSQYSLTETSTQYGMYSPKTRNLFELYIHSLLFQVHAVETLAKNKGSQTPDGLILRNTFESKHDLLEKLKKFGTNKIQPVKRIYIPKNPNEKRPLYIPSIFDRATQTLVLSVLDPIIEPHSDAYSFGFRKGRSHVMALAILQKSLQSKPDTYLRNVDVQYIWGADIRKCSDRINHEWLLSNVPIPPKFKFLLEGWLKAGYVEFGNPDKFPTEVGIPQGGIISPLLMNFTLNGFENLIEEAEKEFVSTTKRASLRFRKIDGWRTAVKAISRTSKDKNFKERAIACKIVRFADDFVVISGSERLLAIIQRRTREFLRTRGLEIHPDKSRVVKFWINTPFDFLGYTFRNLVRTKHIRNKYVHHKKPEYRLSGRPRLFVHPSTTEYNRLKNKLTDMFRNNYNTSAHELIALLNPLIRGWVNYFSYSNAGGTLSSLKKFLYQRIKIWMIKKHPKASLGWLNQQYMLPEEIQKQYNLDDRVFEELRVRLLNSESYRTNRWCFFGLAFKDSKNQKYEIPRINILNWPTNIKNILVATILAPPRNPLQTSIYDNKEKWLETTKKISALHSNKKTSLFEELRKRDEGTCYFCKEPMAFDEGVGNIVVHHITSWRETKNNKKSNLALAHGSCHFDWHNTDEGKVRRNLPKSTVIKFSKNREELKTHKLRSNKERNK